MNRKTDKLLFYGILFCSFIFVLWIVLSVDVTFDAGDGIQHYLIARYSWLHPHLFLDLWGKPFFTLISSPFAQFGLKGMSCFQAICALFTALLIYRIANKLNLKNAWILPVLVFFSPIYFAVINSGLTEIFFGFLFIFSIWLILEKRFVFGAIVVSYLPFIRPEAYVILPLFVLVLLIRKRFYAVPFVFLATIIYSIVGYFYYKDLFWLITNNYKFRGEGYEGMKGSAFHFITHYQEIWGTLYSLLLLIGICCLLFFLFKFKQHRITKEFFLEEVVLIFGGFLGCLVLHSFLYSFPGITNNLGMLRYMAVLIPCSALLALRGLNLFSFSLSSKFLFVELIGLCIVVTFVVQTPFSQSYYPFKFTGEQTVLNEAAKFFSDPSVKSKKVFYQHPHFAIAADLDPFEEEKAMLMWSLGREHLNQLDDSTFIVWDSHFSSYEGMTPIELLFSDTNITPIKHFQYYQKERSFETWIFMKGTVDDSVSSAIKTDTVTDFGLLVDFLKTDSVCYDFDNFSPKDQSMITRKVFYSGQSSLSFDKSFEYGPMVTKRGMDINNSEKFKMVEIHFKFYPNDSLVDIVPVLDVKSANKMIAWYGLSFNQPIKLKEWNSCVLRQVLYTNEYSNDYAVNFYFWNKGLRNFYIDDLCIYYCTID